VPNGGLRANPVNVEKEQRSKHSKIDRSLTYLSPLFYITVDLKWILL
jgi:hypothetical protein